MKMSACAISVFLGTLTTSLLAQTGKLTIESSDSAIELGINDSANGTWITEGSMTLDDWEELKTIRVRNTVSYAGTFSTSPSATGYRFFRMRPSPETQDSTVNGMLDLPVTPYDYDEASTVPSVFGRRISRASIDNDRATLGRVLFHDKRLSANNAVSCASCHQQEHAFADPQQFSIGHTNILTTRNTPSLLHLRTYSSRTGVFMDGRSPKLELAVGEPIFHPEEMGSTEQTLVAELQSEPYYVELFEAAFPSTPISLSLIRLALEDFILSLASFSSKYDQARIAGNFESFSASELSGKTHYENHCMSCHQVDTFSSGTFQSNGLDLEPTDPGRQAITSLSSDHGKFRTPSLRDIALTAPYMHDGRFATLREVLEFYNSGVNLHENLSAPLDGSPLGLSEAELSELEDFLKTLSDESVTSNPAFSDPFIVDP